MSNGIWIKREAAESLFDALDENQGTVAHICHDGGDGFWVDLYRLDDDQVWKQFSISERGSSSLKATEDAATR